MITVIIMAAFAGYYVWNIWKLNMKNSKLTTENMDLKAEVESYRFKAKLGQIKAMPNTIQRLHPARPPWVPKADREPSDDEIASVYKSLGVALPPSLQARIADRDAVLENIIKDLDSLESVEEA